MNDRSRSCLWPGTLLLACSAAPPESSPLPADVDAVLKRSCRSCHGDPLQNFAPMPLMDWENTQRASPGNSELKVYEVIDIRIHSERFPMPPVGFEMSDESRRVLEQWISAGAPPR